MSVADAQYNDDQYNYDPTAQAQGQRELVLMPGVFKVTAQILPRKNKETGEDVFQTDDAGNKWPVYVIPSFSVDQPMDESGQFTVWHEVQTRPTNYGNADQPYVSDGAILLRAIDAEAAESAKSFGEAITLLGEKVSGGPVSFDISTGLTARDSKWAYAEIEKRGLTKENDGKEIQKIWKKANVPTKTFLVEKATKNSPAKFATKAKGPSGEMLNAKVRISQFIPSNASGVEYGVGQFPPKN